MGSEGSIRHATARGLFPGGPPPAPTGPFPGALTGVQDDQGGSKLLSRQQPVGEVIEPGWSRVSMTAKARHGLSSPGPRGSGLGGEMGRRGWGPPRQHDGGAVGEVSRPGAVAEVLQREAEADEARADGEAELEQEAEQEVVLGLRQGGGTVTPRRWPLGRADSTSSSVNGQARGHRNRSCPPPEGLPSPAPPRPL